MRNLAFRLNGRKNSNYVSNRLHSNTTSNIHLAQSQCARSNNNSNCRCCSKKPQTQIANNSILSDTNDSSEDLTGVKDKRIVIYLENWIREQGDTWMNDDKLGSYDDLFNTATHILLAFAVNWNNLNWGSNNNIPSNAAECVSLDPPPGFKSHIEFIQAAKKINSNIKILISYGGAAMGCCAGQACMKMNPTGPFSKMAWFNDVTNDNVDKMVDLLEDLRKHPDKYSTLDDNGLDNGGESFNCSNATGAHSKNGRANDINIDHNNYYHGIDLDYEIPMLYRDNITNIKKTILYKLTEALGKRYGETEQKNKNTPLITHAPMNYFFGKHNDDKPGPDNTEYMKLLSHLNKYIDFVSIQMYNSSSYYMSAPVKDCANDAAQCCVNFSRAIRAMSPKSNLDSDSYTTEELNKGAHKIVLLVCTDKFGGGADGGCMWDENGSNLSNNMTVKQLICIYNSFNPHFGGVGYWSIMTGNPNNLPRNSKELQNMQYGINLGKKMHELLTELKNKNELEKYQWCSQSTPRVTQKCLGTGPFFNGLGDGTIHACQESHENCKICNGIWTQSQQTHANYYCGK